MMYVGLFQSVNYKLQDFKCLRVFYMIMTKWENETVAQIILCKDAWSTISNK